MNFKSQSKTVALATIYITRHKFNHGKKSGGPFKPLIKENGNLTQNDLKKATTFAESLGKIHNTHTGEIFDDEFQDLIDKAINEKSQLFSTLKEKK